MLPLGVAGLFAFALNKEYLDPAKAFEPAQQERLRARGSALWLSFSLCWLGMALTWGILCRSLMRSRDQSGASAGVKSAYFVACGTWINIAEMTSAYIGLGGPSVAFVVLYTASLGGLGFRRSLQVNTTNVIMYAVTALPWVGYSSAAGHPYTAAYRMEHSFPILIYACVLAVPGYIAEALQRRTAESAATARKSADMLVSIPSTRLADGHHMLEPRGDGAAAGPVQGGYARHFVSSITPLHCADCR